MNRRKLLGMLLVGLPSGIWQCRLWPKMNGPAAQCFGLLNEYRVACGLDPFLANEALEACAEYHAGEMKKLGYVGDTLQAPEYQSLNGDQIAWSFGYYAGAGHATCISTGANVHRAEDAAFNWELSPPHSAVLRGNYRDIGVAVAAGNWSAWLGRPVS